MLSLGPLAFASPLVLAGLISLPVIWWLLRVTPPAPQRVQFPALRLLLGLRDTDQDTAHTPWWLLLLRLALAALAILGLSGPILNAVDRLQGDGPLYLVIDDGWPAAEHWEARQAAAIGYLEQAGDARREVFVLQSAGGDPNRPLTPLTAADARGMVEAIQPQPVRPDRAAVIARLATLETAGTAPERGEVVWLADGVDHATDDQADATADFALALGRYGPVRVIAPDGAATPMAIRTGAADDASAAAAGQTTATVLRAAYAETPAAAGAVIARAAARDGVAGRVLARQPFELAPGEAQKTVAIELPLELRNEIATLEVENTASAGALALLDDRWRRRRVGLVSGRSIEAAQPLLSDLYYLRRAMSPYAEVVETDLAALVADRGGAGTGPDIVILADVGRVVGGEADRLLQWIERGGTLVRFAGPRLARSDAESSYASGRDPLMPVTLRRGGRALGGALTWARPQSLQPFDAASPFAGLTVPADVAVNRQVLAEPDITLPSKTWARLEDGTPLVTADRIGDGLVILFHVTANTEWSDLPLSGLYPAMLRRVIELAPGLTPAAETADTDRATRGGNAATTDTPAAPVEADSIPFRPTLVLNGAGAFGPPPAGVRAAMAQELDGPATRTHPPGYYVAERAATGTAITRAKSAMQPDEAFAALPADLDVYARAGLASAPETRLGPWLLLAALVLALADTVIGLWMRGLLPGLGGARVRTATTGVALVAALCGLVVVTALPHPAAAQDQRTLEALENLPPEERAISEATLFTRLAYVRTGDQEIDLLSRSGLYGLTRILSQRTAIEPEDPIGIDPERDEMVFFPLVYWPVIPGQDPLSDTALKRVDDYMKRGGVILFDTRDQQTADVFRVTQQVAPGTQALRDLLGKLDVPPLEPIPEDHVLTKAFYLLQDFPGRWSGGRVWVEVSQALLADFESGAQAEAIANDGVSPLIIGGHDWASAWAIDEEGRYLAAVVPGGPRQRELAYRFGVNIVMYAMTGNYKADQVHVPALLERLGQ